jgi:hypothetical protein
LIYFNPKLIYIYIYIYKTKPSIFLASQKKREKEECYRLKLIAQTLKPNINNTTRGNPGPFQSPFEHLPYQAEDKGKVVTDLLLSNFSKTLQIVKAVP